MKEELEVIQEQLNAILKEGQAKVEEYTKEVETTNLALEQANRDYVKAKGEVNAEGYAKAAQDKRTAQDIAELYNSKIEEVNSKPFISEQEYIGYKNEIVKSMDKRNQKAKKKVDTILEQLEKVREGLNDDLNTTNQLLKTLQIDIYKKPEKYNYINNEGRELTTVRTDDNYKYGDTIIYKIDNAIKNLEREGN